MPPRRSRRRSRPSLRGSRCGGGAHLRRRPFIRSDGRVVGRRGRLHGELVRVRCLRCRPHRQRRPHTGVSCGNLRGCQLRRVLRAGPQHLRNRVLRPGRVCPRGLRGAGGQVLRRCRKGGHLGAPRIPREHHRRPEGHRAHRVLLRATDRYLRRHGRVPAAALDRVRRDRLLDRCRGGEVPRRFRRPARGRGQPDASHGPQLHQQGRSRAGRLRRRQRVPGGSHPEGQRHALRR